MGETGSTATSEASYRRLLADPRLLVTVLIAVMGTFSTGVASPALPGIAAGLDVSAAQVGLVMTAFTVPTAVCVPLTGVLADTYGRRRVVIPALVAYGLAGTAIGLAGSFGAVLALRAVQGVAFAGVMPLSVTILGDLYSGPAGSAAQGIRVSVNGLSGAAVPAAVGVLVGLAWNYPFFLYALAVLAAGVAYVVLPETGDPSGTDRAGLVATLLSYVRAFRAETAARETKALLVGGAARDFVRLAVLTFVPLFAVQGLGASTAAAGGVIALRGLVRMFVSPFAGHIVERVTEVGALLAALAVTVAGVVLIGVSTTVLALSVGVAVYGLGDGLFAPVLKNALTDAASPDTRAGLVNGMQLLKSGAQSLSPVVFGAVLAVVGFRTTFLAAALVSVAYAVVVAVVLR